MFRGGRVGGPGRLGEPGGEVGFPGEFGRVVDDPVLAVGDGGFEVRDAADVSFGVAEPGAAALQLGGGTGAVLVESFEVAPLVVDLALGLVDGGVVGSAEQAAAVEVFETGFVVGQVVPDPGDVVVEPGDPVLVGRHGVAHRREGRLQVPKVAELRPAVGTGVGFEVGESLVVETAEGFAVCTAIELVPEGFGGGALGAGAVQGASEDLRRGRRALVAVAGGGGVGDDAGLVVVAAPGHPDVEVFGAGGAVGEEHSAVDGEAFGLVDGDGVGQRDVLGAVVGGEDDSAVAVEVGDDQGPVLAAGVDLPAVAVSDPQTAGGDEAAVVAGRDDLVAPADQLASDGEAVGFDLAGGDPFGPGPQGKGVDVAWSAAMTTIDWPAARAARQWAKAWSTMASREPPAMRPRTS